MPAAGAGQGFSGYPGLDPASTAAMGGFTPAGSFASEFGMPEIGPGSAPPLHSVPLPNGPALPGLSPQHGSQTGVAWTGVKCRQLHLPAP